MLNLDQRLVRNRPDLQNTKETTVFGYIGEEFKIQNQITANCTEMETSSDIELLRFENGESHAVNRANSF